MTEIETVATAIVDSAVKVHRTLGPGLLESVYVQCHAIELRSRNHKVLCDVNIPIKYAGQVITPGYKMDMFVDDLVIVEHKAVENILPVHEAQLLTYMKLSDIHLGFLINWNVSLIKSGIKRMVYNFPGLAKYPGRAKEK